MGQELNHQEIARNLAKAMADKANENEPVSYTHLTLPTICSV